MITLRDLEMHTKTKCPHVIFIFGPGEEAFLPKIYL